MKSPTLRANFARNLKAVRDREDLTQEDLAEKAGVSVRLVQRLEGNAKNVTLLTIEKFATALVVRPMELLADPVAQKPDNKDKKIIEQAIRVLRSLSSRM
jgi:transcriptional regulator with XRE-family HTH domain